MLRRAYRFARREVLAALIAFVQRENIEVFDAPKGMVILGLSKALERGRLSFGDALILAQMQTAGCGEIYSFDEGFRDASSTVLDRAAG